jgi:probable non-F420 flavinoid oxidoreductase
VTSCIARARRAVYGEGMRLGFHASHEQIAPSRLLADVQHAERAGFDMAMCSDHLSPWSERQGHSGYAWSWLGAALATTDLELGCVCAPGVRYHPAVVAQKIATLAEMFPGRFWTALGSGEASNEHVTGERWPPKEERTQRLEECVDVIRRLLAGEEVTHHGRVTVDRAKVWERPEVPPRLIGPAVSVASAARVAAWADGLVTINQPVDVLRDIVSAYRDAGGRGPLALQVHLSWASTTEEAEAVALDQWRTNVFTEPVNWDTETAEAFDVMGEHVGIEGVRRAVEVSEDLSWHRDRIAELAGVGFDDVYLHFVGQEQGGFIDAFGEHVLPALRG